MPGINRFARPVMLPIARSAMTRHSPDCPISYLGFHSEFEIHPSIAVVRLQPCARATGRVIRDHSPDCPTRLRLDARAINRAGELNITVMGLGIGVATRLGQLMADGQVRVLDRTELQTS